MTPEPMRAKPVRVSPADTRVGWVGLGVMGAAMSAHLLDAGYALTVTTRTRARADALLGAGARWAASARAVAEASDLVFTMVGFPADVREVVLATEGVLAGLAPGAVLVDMTTSEPALAVEIARAAAERGVHALDAPVSGGDVGAREARLSIMVGGERAVFDAVQPALACLGQTLEHQGPAGSGQHTKMVNQTLIASNMVGVCEALLYAQRAGLDPERVLRSVSSGAAGSWSLANLGPRMLAEDYAAGFYVEHFVKDLGIALREARALGLTLPGLSLAESLYRGLAEQGHARDGTQALCLALAGLSGLEWPPGAA